MVFTRTSSKASSRAFVTWCVANTTMSAHNIYICTHHTLLGWKTIAAWTTARWFGRL
jgi:hypothetical protein